MQEPTHAPGWRGRPRRVGPIVGIDQTGAAGERLERAFRLICYVMGAGTFGLGAFVWAADFLAGHIR
jgi:hypothetical protein